MIKTKVRDLSELHEKTLQFILIIIFWRVLFYFFLYFFIFGKIVNSIFYVPRG
jgi:hypothetical protein